MWYLYTYRFDGGDMNLTKASLNSLYRAIQHIKLKELARRKNASQEIAVNKLNARLHSQNLSVSINQERLGKLKDLKKLNIKKLGRLVRKLLPSKSDITFTRLNSISKRSSSYKPILDEIKKQDWYLDFFRKQVCKHSTFRNQNIRVCALGINITNNEIKLLTGTQMPGEGMQNHELSIGRLRSRKNPDSKSAQKYLTRVNLIEDINVNKSPKLMRWIAWLINKELKRKDEEKKPILLGSKSLAIKFLS